MPRESRLDRYTDDLGALEQYVGSLFDTRATANLYRLSGNRYRWGIWVHQEDQADGGFLLDVDVWHSERGHASYRLADNARQMIRRAWADRLAFEDQKAADWQDEQVERYAAMAGVG